MKNFIIFVLAIIALAFIGNLIATYNSPAEVAKRKAIDETNRQMCQTAQFAQTQYCVNLSHQ